MPNSLNLLADAWRDDGPEPGRADIMVWIADAEKA
jgi:hypothetical protein